MKMNRTAMALLFTCMLSACGPETTTSDGPREEEEQVEDNSSDNSSEGDSVEGFCCQGNAYYECTGAQANPTCGDLSGCSAVSAKDRICQGNTDQLPPGASCTDAFDCRGGACAFDDGAGYCSVTCSTDADCPPDWSCEGGTNLVCTRP